jgi:hypothetical protein
MPLRTIQYFARLRQEGKRVEVPWRFFNRKDVSLDDRVFLLLQGKSGPAIIGYGTVTTEPQITRGRWLASIEFESIVDPSKRVLADKESLLRIDGGENFWRTQRSGVKLPSAVASEIEAIVVANRRKTRSKERIRRR